MIIGNPRIRRAWLCLVLFFAVAAEAGAQQDAPHDGHRSASPAGAGVSFVELADGDSVPPTFTVRFAVTGMTIEPAGTNNTHSGHHHLLIDLESLPDMYLPLPKTDSVRHFGGGETEVTLTLPEGQHTLQLLLADYAHIPHQPPVLSERITVTVTAAAEPPQD